MAAYTTDTEVKKLLVGLQPASAYASVDFAKVISRAQNKIDSILGVRYVVPFTTVPARVADMCIELSAFLVYRILLASNKSLGQNAAVWQQNCDEVLQDLKDMAEGKTVLVDAAGAEIAGKAGALRSSGSGHSPVFNVDEPEDWAIPASVTTAIADERAE
jgi:phage gp36-like protein